MGGIPARHDEWDLCLKRGKGWIIMCLLPNLCSTKWSAELSRDLLMCPRSGSISDSYPRHLIFCTSVPWGHFHGDPLEKRGALEMAACPQGAERGSVLTRELQLILLRALHLSGGIRGQEELSRRLVSVKAWLKGSKGRTGGEQELVSETRCSLLKWQGLFSLLSSSGLPARRVLYRVERGLGMLLSWYNAYLACKLL